MANQDWGFGLQPIQGPYDASPSTIRFPLKSSYSTKIYKGQIVLWNTTSGCLKANAVTNPAGNIVGVAAEYYGGSATTKTDLAVWSGDDHVFVIQSDGSLTNRASYLMNNFPVVNPASGSTASGLSTMELDASGRSMTATDQALKVIGFDLKPGDTVATTNVNCKVKFIHATIWQQDVTIT